MDKPSAKYEVIYEIVSQDDNLQNVKELCAIAGVSRSGYYNWIKSAGKARELKRNLKIKLISHKSLKHTNLEATTKAFEVFICAFYIWIHL